MAKTSKTKKTMKAKKQGRKFVKPAKSGPNTGKCVEYFDLGVFEANVAHDFVLNGIIPANGGVPTRASIMAPAFGLYRVAQIEYKIKPKFDTYIAGQVPVGDQPVEVPVLYWKMNRYGDAPIGFTAQDLQSLGSKPIRLDDNTLTIKYKPNILLANAGAPAAAQAGGSGQVKMTPWLSTDTQADNNAFALSTTEHYGHMMFVECAAAGDGTPLICEVVARVVYEFKNPRILENAAHAERRLNTKHVTHTFAATIVKQEQGSQPLGWNLQGHTYPAS